MQSFNSLLYAESIIKLFLGTHLKGHIVEMKERVAVLEEQCRTHTEELETVKETQQEILKQLYVYKGAWGMITMMFGAVVIALNWLTEWSLFK